MTLATHHDPAHVSSPRRVENDCGGLLDTPASEDDRAALLAHLGRETLHGSIGRDFSRAYRTLTDKATGKTRTVPRLYRVESEELGRCEYVALTSKQYAAVMVIDVDQPGTSGGHPTNLNGYVRGVVRALVAHHIGPAWVGINPQSGKAQMIWLIDPVYADENGRARHMRLLAATTRALGDLLVGDPHFSHGFSRSPFYTGKAPTAYRWYRQHNRVMRLGDLIRQVRDMAGQEHFDPTPRQQFTSGRELINAVKTRREQAQAFKALAQDVEAEISAGLDQYDPELIDGVRVYWLAKDTAARDETAFRHALKTGHRLRSQGQRLTDAALIDAYEHAYNVAQAHGGAGRTNDMPPMRDRLTMARRVRGYVVQAKSESYSGSSTSEKATSNERKALATMGRRGGQKAAQRWKTDPQGNYAQAQRETLEKTHKRNKAQGINNRQRVGQFVTSFWIETDRFPSWKEIQEETGLSRATVARHVAALKESGELPTV